MTTLLKLVPKPRFRPVEDIEDRLFEKAERLERETSSWRHFQLFEILRANRPQQE